MSKHIIGHRDARLMKMLSGTVQIDRVQQSYSCRHKRQTLCPMLLVFKHAVPQLTQTIKEYGAGKRVTCLALIKHTVGSRLSRSVY